jgi:transcriptional regulator with XRE-family HTH domain
MVNKEDESFAEFIRRIRYEKRLSLNDVVEKSDGQVSNAYVSKVENGIIQKPSIPKLKGLAKGLDIPESQIIARAQGRGVEESEGFNRSRLARIWQKVEEIDLNEVETQMFNEFLNGLENWLDGRRKKKQAKRG